MNDLFIYIITSFHFFISAATGAAASGCSGTGNVANWVGLLGFHNAVCVVSRSFCLYDLVRFNFKCR